MLFVKENDYELHLGDSKEVLSEFDDESIDCIVTSPPYFGLRDYGYDGQIGNEETVEEYIDRLVKVFDECFRILKKDGTFWLNIGDTFFGHKGYGNFGNSVFQIEGKNFKDKDTANCCPGVKCKELIGIPWMVAFALRKAGWYIRQDIIWSKPNPIPESVTDRCTKSHEYIFMMTKSKNYYFDQDSIKEDSITYVEEKSESYDEQLFEDDIEHVERKSSTKGTQYNGQPVHTMKLKREYGTNNENYPKRNKRDVWNVPTKPFYGAHFAVFPEELIRPCILAGCRKGGTVLDPFNGSGTTGIVSLKTGRNYIGIDAKKEYLEIARKRINDETSQIDLFGGILE